MNRSVVFALQKLTFFRKPQDTDARPGRKSAEEDKASTQRTRHKEPMRSGAYSLLRLLLKSILLPNFSSTRTKITLDGFSFELGFPLLIFKDVLCMNLSSLIHFSGFHQSTQTHWQEPGS